MRKVALITGGGQGIGRAIAIAFAQEGYGISIADIHQEKGLETLERLRPFTEDAIFMKVDVSKQEDVDQWIERTHSDLGSIDVLVNNAGIMHNTDVLELSAEQFQRVISINLGGTFHCSQAAARIMKAQDNGGAIINISSTRAAMSEPNTEAYSASKGGISSLTHAMAISLGGYGIRVNAISPGWIEVRDEGSYSHSEIDRSQHPVGKVGKPEDVAAACLFLASEKAGFITGQNLTVDGGMTVKMMYLEE
ncbi:glucose 1-dehydrogenase [Paenibacillus qinlingensis]|uniref:NAD(P)-dependent dehydrogenase (Short-subunit alcohol dehydrogenase family) n=1 Tax=Paenibacillus qinlingensis TaxID=1837343 RepID=A0ABU1NTP1_9BACL|nr:glucose 1-dehydrogenase [Paenibacillus qinlingensis]MDR6550207.1 NAD(P)-dependent dehydrogenase (short-subunit alcohol dehydrogenase family) [Paenibacillus qinlingensis]